MADYYFDINRGSDSNTGLSSSEAWADPFVKLAVTTGWSAGDNFLFAADSIWNFVDRRNLSGFIGTSDNPIKFSRYYPAGIQIGMPEFNNFHETITTDWTWDAVESGWYWDQPNAYGVEAPGSMVLFGASQTFGERIKHFDNATAFTSDTQWDANPATKRIYVYTPGIGDNPVTYYGAIRISTEPPLRPANTVDYVIFEYLKCSYASTLLFFSNNNTGTNDQNFTVRYCETERAMVSRIFATILNGFEQHPNIHDNIVRNTGWYALNNNSSKTWQANIHSNIFDNTGLSGTNGGSIYWGSGGGVYSPTDLRNNRLYNNTISRARHASTDQLFDGAGIYVESGTSDTFVYSNYISQCHHAFQDNSGGRTVFNGNRAKDCDIFIIITDQAATLNGDITVCNNRIIDASKDIYSSTGGQSAAIINAVAASMIFTTENNIVQVANGSSLAGIATPNATETYIEDYNYVNGGTEILIDYNTSAPIAAGSNSSTDDILAGVDDKLPNSSPCIGSGTKWWTGANPEGFGGEPFSDFDIDIGDTQSTFGPFHPKNL